MNLSQVSEEVARRVESSFDEAHGFISEAVDLIVERLNAGEEVSIHRLGTFKWVQVPERMLYNFTARDNVVIPVGYKLRFIPARQFSTRRRTPDGRRRRDDQTGSGSG